ncbi:glycosyltransferase [Sutcliffiella deserti]|uniref:glycosyltransferase n=1 Tax=Sutcliffiella deserti TaxID=2875501 RepID=UPI001CBC2D55|nr:glycosyltransferase family 2 protein [Sutcliffiella deserti]
MEILIYLLSLLLGLSFLWIIINGFFYPPYNSWEKFKGQPLVSVLVPMRDEERNVGPLIANLKELSYPNVEYIFLDDHSSDATYKLVENLIKGETRYHLLKGAPLKKGWAGKVHACSQLAKKAKGTYLLFLDADVRLRSNTIERMLPFFQRKNIKLVTGFPHFPVTSWLSKLLVPIQHFVIWLHLPLALANYTRYKPATAAHGAFMFFERDAYHSIGGHESVKDSIVEDVHISRMVKSHGYGVCLINATPYVTCHMYETNEEVWNGFLKNIYIGIGKSSVMVAGLTFYYSIFFILPLLLAFFAPFYGVWYTLPLLLVWIQKLYVDLQTKQSLILCLFMPFSAIAFIVIMHASMWKSLKNQAYTWKGRNYK